MYIGDIMNEIFEQIKKLKIKNDILEPKQIIHFLLNNVHFSKLIKLHDLFESKVYDFFHLIKLSNIDFLWRKIVHERILTLEHFLNLKILKKVNNSNIDKLIHDYLKVHKEDVNYFKMRIWNSKKDLKYYQKIEMLNFRISLKLYFFLNKQKIDKRIINFLSRTRNNCAHNTPIIHLFNNNIFIFNKSIQLLNKLVKKQTKHSKVKAFINNNAYNIFNYIKDNQHFFIGYNFINIIINKIRNLSVI